MLADEGERRFAGERTPGKARGARGRSGGGRGRPPRQHDEHGRGWVWGAGRGVVTVRFETAETGPGRVLSLADDDPGLSAVRPPEA